MLNYSIHIKILIGLLTHLGLYKADNKINLNKLIKNIVRVKLIFSFQALCIRTVSSVLCIVINTL